jgi:Protein of unknown function (DUF4197)
MNKFAAVYSNRRLFIAGSAATAMLVLPGCSSVGGLDFTEAIRRLLVLSSERAFARLAAEGGYWDGAVKSIGLERIFGNRGDVLGRILTSRVFKDRLEHAVADVAVRGSYRVAPIVAETVRTIGIANAVDLIRGGPSAATGFLRTSMNNSMVEAMVPEVGDALRVAREPLVAELMSALTGVDAGAVAGRLSSEVDEAIWREIGIEEAAIRANPESTRDPLLIGVFKLT